MANELSWMRSIVLFWLLILTVILLSVPTKCNLSNSEVEGFTDYYGYYKKYCPSCGHRGKRSCGKCTNCILAYTANGHSECIPGNSQGPFFRDDILYYEYGDAETYYNGANVYPIVQMRNVKPYTRWNLNRSLRMPKRLKRKY